MRRCLILAAVIAGLAAPQAQTPSPAASPATTLLGRLAGPWSGSGTILGQPSTVELQWTPVLDGRFTRLTFTSHIGAPPKSQRFEGHAYYEVRPDGGVRATWFDSSGQTRPITAVADASTLVSTWGTPETEVGETTYRLVAEHEMEVVDRVLGRSGTWREFGRSRLSRTLKGR